ncbi:MAG: zinc ribbon domain-containing protein [Planctomycetota bacterium]
MNLRAIVLRSLLGALTAAALSGIFAVFADSSVGGRLAGTSVVLAFACLALLSVVPRDADDRIDLLRGCVLGFVGVAATLTIAWIWTAGAKAEFIGETTFVWYFTGGPALIAAMPALRMRRDPDRSLAIAERVLIGGCFAALALSLLFLLAKRLQGATFYSPTPIASGLVLVGAAICAGSAATGLRKPVSARRPKYAPPERTGAAFAWTGILAAAVSAGALLIEIWSQDSAGPEGGLLTLGIAAATVAAPLAAWNALQLVPVEMPLALLRPATVGALFVSGVLSTILSGDWSAAGPDTRDLLGRSLVASVILTATTLIGAAVAFRLRRIAPISAAPIDTLEWTCPRCRTKAEIDLDRGGCTCTGCGLSVIVSLRDDRCPACSYDLHAMPEGQTNCPECGRARQVPAAH